MSDRAATKPQPRALVWAIGIGLLVVGTAVVAAGASIGDGYTQSVFVNVGTAIGLTGPLYLAERALSRKITGVQAEAVATSRRVQQVQDAVAEYRGDLERLEHEFRAGIDARRSEADALAESVKQGSLSALARLYAQAAAHGSIAPRGLRVEIESIGFWLRVRPAGEADEKQPGIQLALENEALEPVGDPVVWTDENGAAAALLGLASALREKSYWPGDANFSPTIVLTAIETALRRVVELREGPHGDPAVRPIIELVNDDWAITTEGLDSLHSSGVFAESYELVGDSNHAFHRLEAWTKARGLDTIDFRIAFGTAERVHSALERTRAG